jgi:hypothetical protein
MQERVNTPSAFSLPMYVWYHGLCVATAIAPSPTRAWCKDVPVHVCLVSVCVCVCVCVCVLGLCVCVCVCVCV